MGKQIKRVVLYARLSVSKDESVSISRQLDSGRRYAEARGWDVVGEYSDDGVSASHVRPENRVGWRHVLDHPGTVDAVIVWKVDRLARRVLDFLHANQTLQERGAGIVAVEDPIDMTTPQGRAFATVLAVFGELEADAISARVAAARSVLVKSGRVVGGSVPYGWMSIPNPDGPGYVLVQDPERIAWVRGIADQVLAGGTIYSAVRWLDSEGAPLPKGSQVSRKHEGWAYSTVERLLRNPVLAGMTSYNPGRGRHGQGTAVLRDERGLPVVDSEVAIITTEERRRLLAILDGRDTPQARPRASKGTTSSLLSRLVTCDACDQLMHRGVTQGRPVLKCPRCHMTISGLEAHVSERLIAERGPQPMYAVEESLPDAPAELGDIEQAIRETAELMTRDDADVAALANQLTGLKELRLKAREERVGLHTWTITGQSVAEAWEACSTDEERREVLASQLVSMRVRRGRTGRGFDASRVLLTWRTSEPATVDTYLEQLAS